ncbi:MAG: solute carrier family 26 protein [Bacteroidota bacterium]
MKKIASFFPILNWLSTYSSEQLKGDVVAGLTVGIMLIPQGMAYAMIAGLPPIYGLYASTVPLLIYAILGTSRQLAVGPVAMVSLLTAAGVGTLAEVGTETYISLAITLALMVGLFQFLLGVFRLGFLVNFLSHPVISGFTSAAALIIGLSQLKHLLGIDIDRTHHIHEIIGQAITNLPFVNWITLCIGIGGIILLIFLKRIHKNIPAPLIVVATSILLIFGLNLTEHGVKIVGTIPSGLPRFAIPSINWATLQSLFPIALAISLVSFMESYAVAKAIQSKHRNYKVIPNQELIALGLANVGGAFLQSYPVTGGFSRTAVNDQAGAKTGMAAIISAILIVLTLLFLTPLFYFLPKAVLASIIMVAVFGLIDVREAKYLWQTNRSDFWMLVITFLATLVLGIEQGIGIGVLLSLAVIIYRTTRPHIAELGKIPGTHFYRNLSRFEQLEERPDLLIIRFDARLYFANIAFFKEKIEQLVEKKGDQLQTVILNFNSINNIDSSAAHMLEELVEEYRRQDIAIYFTDVKGPVRDAMFKAKLVDKIGKQYFFLSVQKAVESLEQKGQRADQLDSPLKSYTLQSNI